jgi:hypothetical protein
LLIVCGSPYLLAEVVEVFTRESSRLQRQIEVQILVQSLSPVAAWKTLTFPPNWPTSDRREMLTILTFIAAMCCGLFALLAAQLCWWDTCRRFDREGRT